MGPEQLSCTSVESYSQSFLIFIGMAWAIEHQQQHRRDRLQSIIDTAMKHSASNKTHHYFKTIHTSTPKVYTQRPHLRGSNGQLLSPLEEMTMLGNYMTDLYKDNPTQFPSFVVERSPAAADDIAFELGQLEGRKAVPTHIAPRFSLEGSCPSDQPSAGRLVDRVSDKTSQGAQPPKCVASHCPPNSNCQTLFLLHKP